mmetsp:Transcript_4037/g.9249  ORF Transcript_4037/g.9249 Transcript_4037/m.9249 type:complete len:700 (-) Transcript_4037:172-2271(-)
MPNHETIEVLFKGLEVDYYTQSYGCWAPAEITDVDPETGSVKLSTRRMPISRQETQKLLRPRTKPGRRELEWIFKVLREGRADVEARTAFRIHARPRDSGEMVLQEAGMKSAGAELDVLLGVSGSTYELWKRATKEMKRKEVALPPGWQECYSSTTGRVYYRCGQGRDKQTQWHRPAGAHSSWPEMDFDGFVVAFWEMMDAVRQRWGQVITIEAKAQSGDEALHEDYSFGHPWKMLGSGTFGSVYLAMHKKTGMKRAIKKIDRRDVRGTPDKLDSEVGRLRLLDHPNIVRLYDFYECHQEIYLAMDFCSGGDLSGHAKELKQAGMVLEDIVIVSVVRQLMQAVAHIHARSLIHLDIKPANIVVVPEVKTMPPGRGADPACRGRLLDASKSVHVMLIDLGLAKIFRPGNFEGQEGIGTPATMAPEVWSGVVTPAADVFSCGATLFFLLAFKYPFPKAPMDSMAAQRYWAKSPKHTPWPAERSYSTASHELTEAMLAEDRQSRPTATQCLQHRYLAIMDPGADDMPPKVSDRIQRLVKAPERSVLHKSVALAVAASWPSHRLPTIRKAFERLDTGGTGRLTKAQVERALVSLGTDQSLACQAADAVDLSRDGLIDWTEFIAAIIPLSSKDLEKDLRQLFDQVDYDKDGCLDSQGLEELLATNHLRAEVADEVMEHLVGRRGSKAKVDWQTFRRHFKSISAD